MLSVLLMELLLVSLWSTGTCAIFSLTASPVFTMEPLNATENEEPKQAFTVPLDLDLETAVTDPVTDGGSQIGSQTAAVTSTVTPALDNVTDGVENNITPRELTTTTIEPRQPVSLDVFNMKITESSASAVDSAPKDNENNSTSVPVHDPNKANPFDEQPGSYLEIAMENSTEGKECFSNMSDPTGQKGDKGDKGDQGDTGPQGLEGAKGETGLKGEAGSKGDKGEIGAPGLKGEPGESCTICEKGNKGNQGIFGNDGAMGFGGEKGIKGEIGSKGEPGEKGSKGADGMPGPVGPKGDRGLPGATGPQGYHGPAGIPGRKGEKGQAGSSSEHDNIAFSVGLRGRMYTLLPGQPLRFDNIFVNENKPYNVNLGVFVASVEGVYSFSYHLNPSISCLIGGLAHNGRIVVQTKIPKCNAFQTSGSVLLHLMEDDEVWLQVVSGGRNEIIFHDLDSLFSGFLLFALEE